MSDQWVGIANVKMRVLGAADPSRSFLYANGLHLVPIRLEFDTVCDDDTGATVSVDHATVMKGLKLIDYITEVPLLYTEQAPCIYYRITNGHKFYSLNKNVFTVPHDLVESNDNGHFSVVLYVGMTNFDITSSATLKLGFSLEISPDNVYVNSQNSGTADEYITFTVMETIVYTRNMVTLLARDLSQSSRGVESVDRVGYKSCKVYTLVPNIQSETQKKMKFIYSDIDGPTSCGNMVIEKLYCWGNRRAVHMVNIQDDSRIIKLDVSNITVYNQTKVQMGFCIYRPYFLDKDAYGTNHQDGWECRFTVYDQYGNSGSFKNDRSTGVWGNDGDTDSYWWDVQIVDA